MANLKHFNAKGVGVGQMLFNRQSNEIDRVVVLKTIFIGLDLNGLLTSNNETHMGIYFISKPERFQMFTV